MADEEPIIVPLDNLIAPYRTTGVATIVGEVGHALVSDILALGTKEDVDLANVDDTRDLDKPVSTATQTAIDDAIAAIPLPEIEARVVPFRGSPGDSRGEMAKDFFKSGLCAAYFMEEGVGGTEYDYNAGRSATDVVLPADGTVSSAWGPSRSFTAVNGEHFSAESHNLSLGFSLNMGFNTTAMNITRALASQGNLDPLTSNFRLGRDAGNFITFSIRRAGTSSNFDTVVSSVPISSGVDHHVSVWYSYTDNEIGISLDGVVTTARASLNMHDESLPLLIGAQPISADVAKNYHQGEIGYCMLCLGEQDLSTRDLSSYVSADWEILKNDLGVFHAWGDSLTDDGYVAHEDRWTVLVQEASLLGRVANHGKSGYTSGTVLWVHATARLAEMQGQLVSIWVGNNDGITTDEDLDKVVANIRQLIVNSLSFGARQVLVLNIPNRRTWDTSPENIDAHSARLDILNPKIEAMVDEYDTDPLYTGIVVNYIDIRDAFTVENYTPVDDVGDPIIVDADDLSDMALGIIPRSARDDPDSPASTHFGEVGDRHIAATVIPHVV